MSSILENQAQVRGEFPFADVDFETLASIAYDKFGLFLPTTKKPLVYSRLSRRLRYHNLEDFAGYVELLQSGKAQDELTQMLSALTTNVTHFFREMHHFDMLSNDIVPKLIEAANQGQKVRIWSAGCSTGPEPYSIAMCLRLMCPDIDKLDIKILATDIDPNVLSIAKSGNYPMQTLESIPAAYRKDEWISKNTETNTIEVSPLLKRLVTFGELNLIEKWPFSGPFQVIFCRNVVIYFDKKMQEKLWRAYHNLLTDDGVLFIGHSERLCGEAKVGFSPLGSTAFAKDPTYGPSAIGHWQENREGGSV